MVGFWGDPKFEANVRRLNPSATGTGLNCDQGSGPVLWTYTGRKMLPPSTSLPVMNEMAGVNTASLGGYLQSTKTRARWAEGFHELNVHVFDLERDGLRQVVLCPRLTMR